MTTTKKKLFFAAVCLTHFVSNFGVSMQGVLLSSYIDYYHLVSGSQGLTATFQSIGGLASCLLILYIAGRIKKYHLGIISPAVYVLAMLIISRKPSLAMLLVAYMFIGVGNSTVSNVSGALATSLFPGSGTVMGLNYAAYGMGGLIAPIVLRNALLAMPWNQVALLNGIIIGIALVVYLITVFFLRDDLKEIPEKNEKIRLQDVTGFFKKRDNVLLFLEYVGFQAYQNGFVYWVIRYADNCLNVLGYGAMLLSLYWVGATSSRLILPRLKVAPQWIASLGLIITAVTLAVSVLSGNIVVMFIGTAIGSFSSGSCPPLNYLMGENWNPGSTILPMSLLAIAAFIGGITCSPITAFFASRSLSGGMLVNALFALLAGAVMLPVCLSHRK